MQISFFDSIDSSKKEFLDDNEKNIICSYLKGIYLSYDVIIKKLEEVNMLSLFNDIEMPLAETLASMENVGMYIDKEKLKEFDCKVIPVMHIGQVIEAIYPELKDSKIKSNT